MCNYKLFGKRCVDLTIACLAVVLLLPLMVAVALAIRYKLGSPVFFSQKRPGFRGQPFWMIKFRTMTDDCDPDGQLLPDAQRMTAFGKFLRTTSLDELPELWNVLRGEMSIIGPRPLLMEYLSRYTPEQSRRHEVRPGITGWAQVRARNATTWTERFQQDAWYVDHISLRLDIYILLQTVIVVVARRGISAADHATMPRFDENPNPGETHGQAA